MTAAANKLTFTDEGLAYYARWFQCHGLTLEGPALQQFQTGYQAIHEQRLETLPAGDQLVWQAFIDGNFDLFFERFEARLEQLATKGAPAAAIALH